MEILRRRDQEEARRQAGSGRTAPRGQARQWWLVWCECEVNDVSLPYSQPVWTAYHWWSGHTALPGWPAYGSAHPSAASARPCGPTWACSPAGGCAAPCTDGFGSCRCPGTDALSAALWTGGERRETEAAGLKCSCGFGTVGFSSEKQGEKPDFF